MSKLIVSLIGSVIAIVVGVNLMKPIQDAVYTATDKSTSTAMSSILNILPIIFAVMIILGVVKGLVGDGGIQVARREKIKKVFKNSRDFILRIEKESEKHIEFIRNLDDILHIKTELVNDLYSENNPLVLHNDNRLSIYKKYDWYINERNDNNTEFKIIGLNKKDSSKNIVYLLGNKDNKPYLVKLENSYIDKIYYKGEKLNV